MHYIDLAESDVIIEDSLLHYYLDQEIYSKCGI